MNGWTPLQTGGGATTDTAGLNSYVDNLLAQQGGETGADFGKLAKGFTMDDYQADPGYQFRLAEGNKALERKLNASGKTYSPEAANALQSYGQGLASEEYGNAYNRFNQNNDNLFSRLAALSGFGQNAAGQNVASNTNYANAAGDLYTGIGNSITSANVANAANRGSMFNTLVGAGARLGSAYMMSDRRLKHDIQEHGEKNGIKLYKFRYNDHPEAQYIGVMADEVEHIPGAVHENEGYKWVDYSKLPDIEMEEVECL